MRIEEFVLAVNHFEPQGVKQICEALANAVNCTDCPLRGPCSFRGDLECNEIIEHFLSFQ